MPFVDKVSPFNAPNFDLWSPARRSDDRGIVLGAPLDGGQAYVPWIGLSTIRELALKHADRVGLVDEEDLNAAEEEGDRWKREAESLRQRVAGLEAEVELHTRWVQQKLGLDKPPRPMGRPPKEKS